MVDISTKNMNIKSVSESQGENSLEQIYRGYMTSVQITESGYFMRINDVNKIISGKSALKKILEIRNENSGIGNKELHDKINEYFMEHRTVLAKYGNLRTYRVANINFDKSPISLPAEFFPSILNALVEEPSNNINVLSLE